MRRWSVVLASLVVLAACADPMSPRYRRVADVGSGDGLGSLGGTVTTPDIEGNPAPFSNVGVLLLSSPGPGAMAAILGRTHTDAQGQYLFSDLHPGTYGLVVNAPASPTFNGADFYGIQVDAGFRTIVDIAAGRDTVVGDTTGTGGGNGGTVATVAVTPASQTASVGDSVIVMVTLKDSLGTVLSGRSVAWTSSDSTIVYVYAADYNYAVLHAARSGTATIRAVSEMKSGAATVTVR